MRSRRVEIRKQPTITIKTSTQDFALLEKKNDYKAVPISLMDMIVNISVITDRINDNPKHKSVMRLYRKQAFKKRLGPKTYKKSM